MAPSIVDDHVGHMSNGGPTITKTPTQPKYTTEEFDYSNVTADTIVDSMIRNGGCIIRNILPTSDLDEIYQDVSPHLYADKAWDGSFFPVESSRVCDLVGKSKAFIEKIVCNPLNVEVTNKLLSHKIQFWTGNELEQSVSRPQLSSTVVFSIAPGAKPQPLHRDDFIHHNQIPAITAEQYKVGRDTAIVFFVAAKKARKENGATRFVPGSHLEDSLQPPDESRVVYAELEPGDGFIMLGSAYHGGSANTTKDEERLLYAAFTTKGFLRQEENTYLACPLEKIQEYPIEVQKRLGYDLSHPFLGYVDMQTPLKILHPEMEFSGDLYS